jgi:DNA repair exonuclease SbcCD ATPase subunit
VWQSLNNPINVLFIDESLDQGTDNNGVEAAISVLKNLARDRNMSIFVITHKDEFIEQFDTVLYVKKENSFTRLDMSL